MMRGSMRSIAAVLCLLVAAGCGSSRALIAPGAPPALKVAPNEALFLEAFATGVQIYQCRAGEWSLQAPQAELADREGKKLGTHYAGPTWEANDGSKVVGEVKAREYARSPED